MRERKYASPHVRVTYFVSETQALVGANNPLHENMSITGARELEQEIAVAGPRPGGPELSAVTDAPAAICPI
jgi:hypothetical protein